MSTICSKHRQRSEADSLSRVGITGTIKDDQVYARRAPFPKKGILTTGGDNSIVLGSREPEDGRFNTMKTTSFVSHAVGPPLSKDHVLYMRDKHFQFSNDPPTDAEAHTTEYRGRLLAPPSEVLLNRGPKAKKSNESSIFMGDVTATATSTNRDMFQNNQINHKEDNRARVAMHRQTHFALGNEDRDWSSVQRSSYDEKELGGVKRGMRPAFSSVQFGSTDVPGTFESTSKAIYQGHEATRHKCGRKNNNSNVVLGHENRECKSTQRGDFKNHEFVAQKEGASPRVKDFTVKAAGTNGKASPLRIRDV